MNIHENPQRYRLFEAYPMPKTTVYNEIMIYP
jgi:hypothetical protein